MDFKAFYDDVLIWINYADKLTVRHGIHSSELWSWVTSSEGFLCEKYNNHPLVIRQMIMLHRWLEDMYNQNKQG